MQSGNSTRQFILTVLREANWHRGRLTPQHLRRTLRELNLDICALRKSVRRPRRGIGTQKQKKLAGSITQNSGNSGVVLDRQRCKRARLFQRKNHKLRATHGPERNVMKDQTNNVSREYPIRKESCMKKLASISFLLALGDVLTRAGSGHHQTQGDEAGNCESREGVYQSGQPLRQGRRRREDVGRQGQ